jgi:hypothetical protein
LQIRLNFGIINQLSNLKFMPTIDELRNTRIEKLSKLQKAGRFSVFLPKLAEQTL